VAGLAVPVSCRLHRSRLVVLLSALLLAGSCAIAGCGVTTESKPHVLETKPPVTVAPPSGHATRLTDVWFLRNDRLVAVERPVPDPVS
jgi:hypothetical protein